MRKNLSLRLPPQAFRRLCVVSLSLVVASLSLVVASLAGCSDNQALTTTRNLLRPGPVGLACLGQDADGAYAVGLAPERCSALARKEDGPVGSLFGLVANTARGDVAVFKTTTEGEDLLDLDRQVPGYGFVPVGALPRDLAVSADSCFALVTNSGSCDLSMLDVPGVLQLWQGTFSGAAAQLSHRIVPRTKDGRALLARPHGVVVIPAQSSTAIGASCEASGEGRAYVSFPGCNLVAEIDLKDGTVLQALVVSASGALVPTDNPSCRPECQADGSAMGDGAPALDAAAQSDRGSRLDSAAPSSDGGAGDAAPLDQGGASDATTLDAGGSGDTGLAADATKDGANDKGTGTDGSMPPPADAGSDAMHGDLALPGARAEGALPTALALVPGDPAAADASSRLYISAAGANFLTVLKIDEAGAFVGGERIVLEGTRAEASAMALSPEVADLGRFVYVVVRDGSVRVVSDRLQRECETNMDLTQLPKSVPLAQAGCYPVGTVARRTGADGPGLRFAAAYPLKVAFAQVGQCRVPSDCTADHNCVGAQGATPGECRRANAALEPQAVPLIGVYAYIAVSDGNVFVVDIRDSSRVLRDNEGQPIVARPYFPHRPRNSVQGRLTEDDYKPGLLVERVVNGGSGGVPLVITSDLPPPNDNCPAEACGQRDGCCPLGCEAADDADCGPLVLRARGESVNNAWAMVYESRLVGRSAGQLALQGGALRLLDPGAELCRAGVLGHVEEHGRELRHGDIVRFTGCLGDQDCGIGRSCKRVVGQSSEYGLCFDRGREEELYQQCSGFLRGKREFLVRQAKSTELVLDLLPEEPQRVVDRQSTDCSTNGDCPENYLCALADRSVERDSSQSLSKGECFLLGCKTDLDCHSGVCLAPLEGGPLRCMAAPEPLEWGGRCGGDEDCRPLQTGGECITDRDCDAAAECRFPTSTAVTKRCVDRGRLCSHFKGRGALCVRPSPCFGQLQSYDVRAGRAFIIGSYRRVIADPQSGECAIDPSKDSLLEHRIPIGQAVYPVELGTQCRTVLPDVPDPNPCVVRSPNGYKGFEAKGGAEGEREVNVQGPAYQIQYANPDLAFRVGLSQLTTLPSTAEGQATAAPMPEEGLRVELNLRSGHVRLLAALSSALALPSAMISGPDGYLYLVDSGDLTTTAGTRRGQVLRFRGMSLELDTAFLAK